MEINAIVTALPPTPAKFHYIFNLRDLSRVVEGVLCVTPDKQNSPLAVVRLLRHELLRIFGDRLVDDADRDFVNELVEKALKGNFADVADGALENPILFGELSQLPCDRRREEWRRLARRRRDRAAVRGSAERGDHQARARGGARSTIPSTRR